MSKSSVKKAVGFSGISLEDGINDTPKVTFCLNSDLERVCKLAKKHNVQVIYDDVLLDCFDEESVDRPVPKLLHRLLSIILGL